MHNRIVVPVGTELECYSNWATDDTDLPVYTGAPEDAFMSMEPGLYPGSYVESTQPDGPWSGVTQQINILLVVTDDESFAVTTDQSYIGPMPVDTDPDGRNS